MKKRYYISLFIILNLLSQFYCYSQNLVPNSGFENYNSCDSMGAGIWKGNFPFWDSPSNGSFDGFNTCYPFLNYHVPANPWGFQIPHTGNGYVGGAFYNLVNNWEYLQVELDSQLVFQKPYCASFYISTANRDKLACNNIGIYFSDSHVFIPTTGYLNFIPQINDTNIVTDTANWILVSGQYIAQGGEKYMIIGDFFPDSLTDTIHLNGTGSSGYAYYYIDDVSLMRCDVGIDEMGEEQWKIEPNPATEELRMKNKELRIKNVKIYNSLGEIIYKENPHNAEIIVDISSYPKGVYFISCLINNQISIKKFVKM